MTTVERLLALQEQDLMILRIETELQDIPARKAREQERLEQHKEALQAAESGVQAAQASLRQHELEVQTKRDQIAKLRTQQMNLKTNKEFKAMSDEIEGVERSIRRDEDNEITIMEKIESSRGVMAAQQAALDAEQKEVDEDVKVFDERAAELDAELRALQTRRKELVEGIEPEWLQRYEVILQRRRGAVLVSSASGVCGGCHMAVPPYQQHAARKQLEMVVCGYCGRMLY
ncbi:MAG: zinc ribbon domain-containing protein [Kiritimatiellia bacterium]